MIASKKHYGWWCNRNRTPMILALGLPFWATLIRSSNAFGPSSPRIISLLRFPRQSSFSSSTTLNNFLGDIGDLMSGGKLEPQRNGNSFPYGPALSRSIDEKNKLTLAIQERPLSFSGEDFDVVNAKNNAAFCKVRGAMLHLPGKDKMRLFQGGKVVAALDRKLVAMTATYDIYRGDCDEKIGWLEKAPVALTNTFEFHAEKEQSGSFGTFKPPAAYKLEGDFINRRFVMKNSKGQVVAKVTKDSWIQFDAFNNYQVQVAEGMDPVLVIACAAPIDEEFDEEHRKQQQKRES